MKWCAAIWTCTVLQALCAEVPPVSTPAPKPSPPAPATLQWNNGETIPGELIEATPSEITWKTSLFEEPLVLGWSALRRVDRLMPGAPASEPFIVSIRDGSLILGDLVSVTENSIAIHSVRHGDVTLKRSDVLSLRRMRGGGVVFAGPVGDVGWDAVAKENSRGNEANSPRVKSGAPRLQEGVGGALLLPYWNSSALLKIALPDSVDVEFRVRSSVRPDFQVSLEANTKQRLRIETWDDDLVLVAAEEFKRIRKINDDERDIALRICWNRKTRNCSVFTPAGELMTEWQVPEESESSSSGVTLQSKDRDLALEFLRVRAWDGKPPTKIDHGQSRVELADGRIVVGQVGNGPAGEINFRAKDEDGEHGIPFAEVAAVIFSAAPAQSGEREVKFSYADGTLLLGRPLSIKDGKAMLETSFSEQSLTSLMDGLRQLLIQTPAPAGSPPEPALTGLDKLVIQETTLHGKLTGVGDVLPRWTPVGSTTPVTPSKLLASEFNRSSSGVAPVPAPALFYMSSGDVIPGRLRALERANIEFESDMVAVTKVPAGSLDAIQFGMGVPVKIDGFQDGWRVLKGTDQTVRRTKDSLVMEEGTSISHEAALLASEIKFSLAPRSGTAVRLRLFCSGVENRKSLSLVLMNMGNRIVTGLEEQEGEFEEEFQTMVPSGRAVPIRLSIRDHDVALQVNGVETQTFPVESSQRAGSGLIIEPAVGNSTSPVELTGFSAKSDPGQTRLPEVSDETRMKALTVPRFRKDNPPRYALLAANGDVLRGEIEATTATHFGFLSGLENLRVPRDRVKAAIFLKKPDPDAPVAASRNPVFDRLEQKITERITYGGANLSTLIEFLRREAPDLKFKLPDKDDNRDYNMSFGGQTIKQALEQICSMIGVKYRIDDDGTIIVEERSEGPKDMVHKLYWLKTDAFNSPALQEMLSGKGISFPSGAKVNWNRDARQLSMINTKENQAKLADVIAKEFGGILDSPTHWLLLANGARLGLVVDKFEQDTVVGHHPVYGHCKVPLSEIVVVRSSMPEASAAMKSLSDWRLVFAPEPVLPDNAGQNSPLLGKVAKVFKLPLLTGGEFDLGTEKGKVVVLDFWATWCGPCIKAMPELMEAISPLPPDRVKLIGVNQGEPPEQVKEFMETRRWELTVALDSSQNVAAQYGLDGIPFTVIVAPDGKVAWVQSGYSPESVEEIAKVVKQLMGGEPPAGDPAGGSPQ